MKQTIFLTLITVCFVSLSQAQTDSVELKKKRKASVEVGTDGINIHIGKTTSDTVKVESKKGKFPKVNFGFNFEHFDLGLSKYHIDDDFSLPTGYDFLESSTWKTHTVGFDALQFGVRFDSNFKIMLAAGLDWNHIRLERDITILPDNATVDYVAASETNLKKNRFTSRYIRIPLYFEYRTNQIKNGKRVSFVAGPEIGFLIDGKVKQKTESGEKIKVKDDYNFEPFRYGANLRLGYGGAGLFFKYYFNDVFAKNEAPGLEGYKNLSFGLTLGF